MNRPRRSILLALVAIVGSAGIADAQQPEPTTRTAVIEQSKAEKARSLTPYVPNRGERLGARIERVLTGEGRHGHPFFESAYSGGGFALGAGYLQHVSPYNFVDVRGSYSVTGYKRAEIEFRAPRLFHRRGDLSLLVGYREATEVRFFGRGMDTSQDDRTDYAFTRPYRIGNPHAPADPAIPAASRRRRVDEVVAGSRPAAGSRRSKTVFTPATLPGLSARDDVRPHARPPLASTGEPPPAIPDVAGFYGITAHDYKDTRRRIRLPAGRLRSDPARACPA